MANSAITIPGIGSEGNAKKIQGRDIATTAPADGEALVWNAGTSEWEPGEVAGGGGGDFLTLPQLSAAPTVPASGNVNFFAKDDGFVYVQHSDGAEDRVRVLASRTELVRVSNGDTNGAFYYAGTEALTTTWANPYTSGAIGITSSAVNGGSLTMIVDRTSDTGFLTQTTAGNAFITIDLMARSLILKGYTYRNRNNSSNTNPTSMRVLGSNDNSTFTEIDVYSHDNTQDVWNNIEVTGETTAYRYIKFNSVLNQGGDTTYLVVAELELYGTLFS